MKAYIMTDMEGVAGVISSPEYGSPEGRYYQIGRELTTLEVNAAIEGCLEAGATDILVVDGHGPGAIDIRLLHPAARLLAGRPVGYPFGCSEEFDVALNIGQHAKSNTDGGHLSHTGSFAVEELTINGVSLGELGKNMLFAAYFGVPTVTVTGDRAVCEEARALVPGIETAAVKEGLKRGPAAGLTAEENQLHNGAAIHLSLEAARSRVKEAARRGLERRGEIGRFWLEPPYEMVTTTRPANGRSGRTVVVRANDLLELLTKPS
ncbi:MAG: aminopeptidase [Anaerolineae bacterium]|nr:aminopeptidase [Anaerolineae bacterium]